VDIVVQTGGDITLADAPSAATDAVNKTYSDLKVLKAGDTMTGPLVLDDTSLQVQEGADTMTITVPTLTAARAVTFPDAAGGVVLDSGTGTAACSNGQILKQSGGVWTCGADVNTGVTSIANDLWVSTDGTDSPNNCSVGQPCATIQYAIMQAYIDGPPSSTDPWRVNVAPGTYTEDDIQFTQNGVNPGHPVDWVSIQGSGEKATIIQGDDINVPIFDFTGAGNCSLYGLSAKGKLGQIAPNILLGPGWHNIRLWNVGSTGTTQEDAWSALDMDGIGATLWARDFTPFNLAANEEAPLIRYRIGGAGTATAGFCTDGDSFGACLVDADCGTGGSCAHGAADTLMERAFIQSDAFGAIITGNNTCYGGATTLTGSINPTASTAVVGVGTAFTTEIVIGEMIAVSGETRTVTVITDNTNLTVSVAFTDVANDATPQVSNDGWPCSIDGDCDTSGTCGEGVCSDDVTLSCTEANEASACVSNNCLVGQAFNNIWQDNRWQISGDEGGLCPEDTSEFAGFTKTCTACTLDSECNAVFPNATCDTTCVPLQMGMYVEGDNHVVNLAQDDFVCNRKSATCVDPDVFVASAGGAVIEECGTVITGEQQPVVYTKNGNVGSVSRECATGASVLYLDPLGADPTTAAADAGAVWFNTATSRLMFRDTAADVTVLDSTNTVGVANGGTGVVGFTTGDILYADGSFSLNQLSGTVDRYLKYEGTAPLWTTIDLGTAASFSNALGEAQGGFGEALDGASATADCVYTQPGTGAPLCLAMGTDTVLVRDGTGDPSPIAITSNSVLIKKTGTIEIETIATNEVLGRDGGTVGSIKVEDNMWSDTAGDELAVPHGGTGVVTVAADAVLIGAGTSDMAASVIADCNAAGEVLQYTQSSNTFACETKMLTEDTSSTIEGGNTLAIATTADLTIADAPSAATDAVNKTYSDLKVLKAGDTLTGDLVIPTGVDITVQTGGDLTLADAPTVATDAVNKSYHDTHYCWAQSFQDASTSVNTRYVGASGNGSIHRDAIKEMYPMEVEFKGVSVTRWKDVATAAGDLVFTLATADRTTCAAAAGGGASTCTWVDSTEITCTISATAGFDDLDCSDTGSETLAAGDWWQWSINPGTTNTGFHGVTFHVCATGN